MSDFPKSFIVQFLAKLLAGFFPLDLDKRVVKFICKCEVPRMIKAILINIKKEKRNE